MDISVVIPAYNEAERLPPTLQKVVPYLEKLGMDWELLVVDNNSTDNTADIIKHFAEKQPRVKLIFQAEPGKGAALHKGMLAAQGDIVLFSDADLSCPIEEEVKLREALYNGYDVAIASRRLKDSIVDKSLKREAMSALFNWMVQLLALPGIRDSQCGFKAFKADVNKRLFAAGLVTGWAFDVEILFLARKCGYRIAELPVRWVQVEGSKVSAIKDAICMAIDIIKFRIKWMKGAYKEALGSDK